MRSQRPRHLMPLWMRRCLSIINHPGLKQLLRHRMDNTDLLQPALLTPIHSLTPNIKTQPLRRPTLLHNRGARHRSPRPRTRINSGPQPLHSDLKTLMNITGRHRFTATQRPKNLHNQLTGHIASLIAAHPVSDEKHRRLSHDSILIELPHLTLVSSNSPRGAHWYSLFSSRSRK